MKLKKIFLLFILTLSFDCIIYGMGGNCQFCGKWRKHVKKHEQRCLQKTNPFDSEHLFQQLKISKTPPEEKPIISSIIKTVKKNIKPKNRKSLNQQPSGQDLNPPFGTISLSSSVLPIPFGEESLLEAFDDPDKTDSASPLDHPNYQSQNLFEFKNEW